jgi:hypothetical protein
VLLRGINAAFSSTPDLEIFKALAVSDEDGEAQFNLAAARARAAERAGSNSNGVS